VSSVFALDGSGNIIVANVNKVGAAMTIQTVELSGKRYVILPEREFLELQKRVRATTSTETQSSMAGGFREVVPLCVDGIAASELLIQDRR
jgi:hypothetical protein